MSLVSNWLMYRGNFFNSQKSFSCLPTNSSSNWNFSRSSFSCLPTGTSAEIQVGIEETLL